MKGQVRPTRGLATLVCICLLTGFLSAAEETIHFREGGGSGYTDVLFDDTWIENYYPDGLNGSASYFQAWPTAHRIYALLAIKDMFTELPKTTGGSEIDIRSATLHLFRYNSGSSSTVVSVYQMTTDWIPDDAGSNENDVNFNDSEDSSTTRWGGGGAFSTSDYDSSVCETGYFVDDYEEECEIVVTDVIAELYNDEVNYGLLIDADANINMSSSDGTAWKRPSLEITYEYTGGATYTLTVNSGTGDGSYAESAEVGITADTPPSGQDFDKWVGDTSGIASVTSSSTTLTMPAANQEVTATYTDKTWTLTVNSGTGDGSYVVATEVPIAADTPPSGQDFVEWIGETEGIASVTSSSTNLTMPYANAEVTATYTDKVWALTVNSGTGDGSYSVNTEVPISADTPPSGQEFDEWIGDTEGIANVNSSSTTLMMPYANAEVTATYTDKKWTLTVHSGFGGGQYVVGTIVDIDADEPPQGTQFDEWVGDTEGIANVNAASTTLTMPYANAEITATYAALSYTLTVNSGSGDGSYAAGTVVDITADAAPSGKAFDEWVGDAAGIADVTDPSTTLTMPASNAEITATYADLYVLTVNSGTGDGSYQEGEVVDISADGAPSGKFFDAWTGDTGGIADLNDPTTTLTMPASAAEVTAAYADVADGLVSRFTFDVDARDTYGNNDGTLTGGAAVVDDATRGKVLSLDGTDDYVVLPTGGMTAGRSEATLSVWVNPDVWSGGRTIYDEEYNWYWQFSITADAWYTRDTSTGTNGIRDNDIALPTVPTGQWHYLTFVYSVSGGKKEIYYDGDLYSSTSTSIDTLTSSRINVCIGWPSDGNYFDGKIDDLRLYNRALTKSEIAELAGEALYTLTVNSGTGDGDYVESEVVNIAADAPASGTQFDKWIGDTSYVANVNVSGTTVTMPASNVGVTATYVNVYTLTVNSGDGDGVYEANTVVEITADAAASGTQFDEWTGDVSGVADVTDPTTTITMSTSDAEITGTYVNVYTLTVNSGSGDGVYQANAILNITADAAPSGYEFDEWTGDTSGIAAVTESSTTITMPSSDAEITATYQAIAGAYALTVNSGSGDGTYDQNDVANISADAAGSGRFFDKWIGDTSGIADVNDPTTTLTMPASDSEVTATYAYVVDGLVSRYTFDVDARDTYGTNNGTLTNGASVTNDGTRGKVASFDGTDDYVDLPSSAMTSGRSEVTVTMWVKPDTWDSADTVWDEYAEGAWWQFSVTQNTFYTRDTSTGTTGTRNNDVSMPSLSTGSWHHLAFVYSVSAGKKEIWHDGSVAGTSTTSIDQLTSDRDGARIGYPCDGNYYDGLVDDVRLYNRALSSTEIATLAEQSIYTLIVNGGSGDGDYAEDDVVNIVADSAPSGQAFDEWTGDTSGIANVNASSTTITMPGSNAEITSTYANVYTLTVNSGSGDGSYQANAVVVIAADTAPSGTQFGEWVGDTANIADVTDPTTTITMSSSDAETTATYTNLYTLTVNSGSGDGSYLEGTVVDLTADTAPSGTIFNKWTGETQYVADVLDPTTIIVMPASNTEITAGYVNVYTLTVNSGSGDGTYEESTQVEIAADAPASGKVFDQWTGDTSGIADVDASTTTLTMPASDTEVTATYVNAYTLTVSNGTGDGVYESGTVVNIAADAAASGAQFDKWTGDTSGIADVNAPSTTITMPSSDAEITASYVNIYTLTVNSGSGDGLYTENTIVDIVADPADTGKVFDAWIGDTSDVADVNADTTTVTMPASDATVTATYKSLGGAYTLTVNSGTGDGDYAPGQVVDITADAAASGEFFDKWTGDVAGIADINDGTTTIVMPESDAQITATYADVASGLVSRYTFDTDARDTRGANDGTLVNGAFIGNDATRGKVLSLDGTDDYVDLPSGSMTAGRSEVTLSMWIKPDEWVILGGSNTIWDEYAETSFWQFSILEDGWRTRDSSTGTTGGRNNDLAMPTVPTGQWHHLAFVYSVSGGQKAIYYDGALDTSSSTSIDTLTSDRNAARIGYPAEGFYYDGMIDDVRLYDRALGRSEIALLAGETLYTLTVNSGSGDGGYVEGEVVSISADAAPSGQAFDEWIGDTSGIAAVNSANTTLTMPAANQEVTATYVAASSYTLTVNSGSGDGTYTVGMVVNISADSPPGGKTFDVWVGDTSTIANVNAASTTLTMPSSNAEITATYADIGTGPSVTSTSGTWSDGNSVTISGSGFGSKSQAAPKVWDNFDGGSNGQSIEGESPIIGPAWDVYTSHGTPPKYSNVGNRTNSALCSMHDFVTPSQYNCSLEYYLVTDTAYFTFWWKYDLQSGIYNRNTKPWVEYGQGDGMWPSAYIGFGNPDYGDGGLRSSVQDQPMPTDPTLWGGTYLPNVNHKWIRIEQYLEQSSPNVSNGTFMTWVHEPYAGSPFIKFDLNSGENSYMTRTRSYQWRQWTFGGAFFARDVEPAGGGGPVDAYVYSDDIYFDTTRARVEVGNASTWSGCTQREIQIPSSWSSTAVTITVNEGGFSSFSGKYVYVVDSEGRVNANGYACQ